MELRHLRYFAAVAETRHFGRAAEQLHLAQPALSQAVRQLEAELGTPLFTRTTRQVRLTPAGEFLQAEARRVLAAVEDSIRGVRRLADGQRGLLRIAFTGTAVLTLLPRVARLVRAELPEVALEIHADLLTPAQVEGLESGTLDLGVLRPPVTGEHVTTRRLGVEPLVAALPADHPLADAPHLAVPDLRGEGFVLYADSHSAVNDAVLASCAAAGFSPRTEHRAPSTSVLLALVAAGLGVALVPASVRAAPLAGVVLRDVSGAVGSEVALAWRTGDDSPLLARVLELLTRQVLVAPSPTGVAAPVPDTSSSTDTDPVPDPISVPDPEATA